MHRVHDEREYSLGYRQPNSSSSCRSEYFAFLIFANRNGQISFIRGNKVLATGTVEGGQDVFRNVAVAWNNGTITLLYDGRKILEYELDEKCIFTNAMENGHRHRRLSAWRSNSSDMLIDEVRISKPCEQKRYRQPQKSRCGYSVNRSFGRIIRADGFSLTSRWRRSLIRKQIHRGRWKRLVTLQRKANVGCKRRKEIFKLKSN